MKPIWKITYNDRVFYVSDPNAFWTNVPALNDARVFGTVEPLYPPTDEEQNS
jgi:hypothetical protein